MRCCPKCKIEKEEYCFDRSKSMYWCKDCRKTYRIEQRHRIRDYNKRYHEAHREEMLEKSKRYHAEHRETELVVKRQYHKTHRSAELTYNKLRRKNNIQVRLASNLRSRLRSAIKNSKKVGSAVNDLGCTIQELKLWIESRFESGMTWDNWGYRGWHIDHVVPLIMFDLTNREQLLIACNYKNLQPLWAKDNMSKGAKMLIETCIQGLN